MTADRPRDAISDVFGVHVLVDGSEVRVPYVSCTQPPLDAPGEVSGLQRNHVRGAKGRFVKSPPPDMDQLLREALESAGFYTDGGECPEPGNVDDLHRELAARGLEVRTVADATDLRRRIAREMYPPAFPEVMRESWREERPRSNALADRIPDMTGSAASLGNYIHS